MKNNLLFSLSFVVLFYGCSSSKPAPAKQKDVPDWYLMPPKMEGKYVGVGDAKKPQLSLSKSVATTKAQAEISRAIETEMSTMVKDFLSSSGIDDTGTAVEYSENVTKAVSSAALKGCQIEKTEIINGRVFVMVVYDAEKAKAEAKRVVEAEAKKDEALYNEFKAVQGFDALNKEIDNLKY